MDIAAQMTIAGHAALFSNSIVISPFPAFSAANQCLLRIKPVEFHELVVQIERRRDAVPLLRDSLKRLFAVTNKKPAILDALLFTLKLRIQTLQVFDEAVHFSPYSIPAKFSRPDRSHLRLTGALCLRLRPTLLPGTALSEIRRALAVGMPWCLRHG